MPLMAEMREQRFGRLGNRDALMAWPANSHWRQITVLHARAMRDRCVTTGAIRFQLQMHAMRKRRSPGRRRENRTGKNELAQASVKKSDRACPAPTDMVVSAAHSAGPLDYFTDPHAHRRGSVKCRPHAVCVGTRGFLMTSRKCHSSAFVTDPPDFVAAIV
jgi:hypothetical protein